MSAKSICTLAVIILGALDSGGIFLAALAKHQKAAISFGGAALAALVSQLLRVFYLQKMLLSAEKLAFRFSDLWFVASNKSNYGYETRFF